MTCAPSTPSLAPFQPPIQAFSFELLPSSVFGLQRRWVAGKGSEVQPVCQFRFNGVAAHGGSCSTVN
eukprot:1595045-Alexandrium_andersonii.AAC.2